VIRYSGSCVAVTAFGALLFATIGTVAAAAETPVPNSKVSWYGDPSAPNISGVWARVDTVQPGATSGRGSSKEGWRPWPPPLKGQFAAKWKQRVSEDAAGKRTDDPVRACLPPGMPRYMSGTQGPMLIIQTPGRVTLYRDGMPVRRVWLDGRKNPEPDELEDFSNGNAIGHYEGQELVTEIIGLKDYPIDGTGVPHSPQLQIAERFRRVDEQTLRVDITLSDPLAYSRPMTSTVTYKAWPDPLWEPREFICTPVTNYHPDKYVR
jgi:hypothetical protein